MAKLFFGDFSAALVFDRHCEVQLSYGEGRRAISHAICLPRSTFMKFAVARAFCCWAVHPSALRFESPQSWTSGLIPTFGAHV